MKKSLKSLFIIFLCSFLISCQGLKETLSMKKKKSVDEFLIEKKNPLTLPPEFSKLPKPKEIDDKIEAEDDLDLSELLGKSNKKKSEKIDNEIEKSIIDILKKK
mgnify:CR=1 FL=1